MHIISVAVYVVVVYFVRIFKKQIFTMQAACVLTYYLVTILVIISHLS